MTSQQQQSRKTSVDTASLRLRVTRSAQVHDHTATGNRLRNITSLPRIPIRAPAQLQQRLAATRDAVHACRQRITGVESSIDVARVRLRRLDRLPLTGYHRRRY